jgi:hypothetical protein
MYLADCRRRGVRPELVEVPEDKYLKYPIDN